jgi:hypothetical protein
MPSSSKKQQAFMGADLGRLRAGKKTKTGMKETQLRDYASGPIAGKGSLEDIDFHEEAAETDKLCDEFTHPVHKGYDDMVWGELDPPALDGKSQQFTKGKQSCNRDAGQGLHYGAPVDYFGPDTDYRAEEINPQDYGRDYDPFPFRDMFKDQKKDTRPNLRLLEEAEYSELRTPGAVNDKAFDDSLAHGAVSYEKLPVETDDYRGFESQQKFRRNIEEPDADIPKLRGRDTKYGKNIR